MSPQLHATFLGIAAVGALATGALVLARPSVSASARVHFVYTSAVAWWFVSMAMIATSATPAATELWSRLLLLSLGMLPAIIYHLNVALAGLDQLYRKRIRAYWALSLALTLFAVSWPTFLASPSSFAWGYYPRFTGWGFLLVAALLGCFIQAELTLRHALELNDPRSMLSQKMRWFYVGNFVTALALLDYLPVFGVETYPFGWVVITFMNGVTVYGSLRYRLTEISPEFAAEHVLREMPDGLLLVGAQGLVRVANRSASETLGCRVEDLVGQPLGTVGRCPEVVELLRRGPTTGVPQEVAFKDGIGAQRYLRVVASPILDAADIPVAHLWILRCITAERLAQEEKERFEVGVRNMQKLESLGVMASGIAHDFNNLLLTILGNAELARRDADDAGSVQAHVKKIEAATVRAAELTGQMLTYTGNAQLVQEPVDLNQVVAEVAALMRVAISKKAALTLDLYPDLPEVVGDPVQMSQVILNLITNASEALDGGSGSIILRTGVTRPDDSFQRWGGALRSEDQGKYVILEAQDTGRGMNKETVGKIFDPFFTTKLKGRGLGLATVLGIVRAHSGLTRVTSAPDGGTTFTIALPAALRTRGSLTTSPAEGGAWRGEGLALVADDEPQVRALMRSMLADAGFSVIEACDGGEAVVAFQAQSTEIDVVVMDRTMPGLDGLEVFDRIRAVSSEVPVVFVSGYADTPPGTVDERTKFLQKPFRAAALTTAVREVMLGE